MEADSKKKIIFFDIDGTLVGFNGKMPESTKDAIALAKQAGHKVALCTGRSRCQIYPWLLETGFDGIIAAAGAYVECGGKVIYHRCMERRAVEKAVAYFEENRLVYGFQSADATIVRPEQLDRLRRVFLEMGVEEERIKQLIAGRQVRSDNAFYDQVEKMMYYRSKAPVPIVRKALAPEMDVVITSFEEPDESSGEVSGFGIHKGAGMEKMLSYYGMKQEDTVAFGDGPNDVEMLQFAKIGVAMGNSVEFLKQYAYMVTDDIQENGIMHALQKLGIL